MERAKKNICLGDVEVLRVVHTGILDREGMTSYYRQKFGGKVELLQYMRYFQGGGGNDTH